MSVAVTVSVPVTVAVAAGLVVRVFGIAFWSVAGAGAGAVLAVWAVSVRGGRGGVLAKLRDLFADVVYCNLLLVCGGDDDGACGVINLNVSQLILVVRNF